MNEQREDASDSRHRLLRLEGSVAIPHEPERAIAAGRLVGGKGQPGEGENFRCVGDPAVVGIAGHVEKLLQALVVQWQFPVLGKFRQLAAQAVQAGAVQGIPSESGSEMV